MTAVETQPRVFSHPLRVKAPMIRGLDAMSIMITMNGTAATPLNTADQNNAWMGSIAVNVNPSPSKVEAASTA